MSNYLDKIIKVELLSKFYYKGKVIFEDEDFLVLIDMTNKEVRINRKAIACLEVLS